MWIYNNKEFTESDIPEKSIGFIYKITRLNINEDNISPMYYIGKKLFKFKSKKKLIKSDWETYYGSSDDLNEAVKLYGSESFMREIIRICYSKSELTYHEVIEQINNNVLRVDNNHNMRKKFYNKNIFGKFYTDTYFTKDDIKRIKDYLSDNDNEDRCSVAYFTNDIDTKSLYYSCPYELEQFALDNPGYIRGNNIHSDTEGKLWVNKGVRYVSDGLINVAIYNEEIDNFLDKNPDFYAGTNIKGNVILVNDGIVQKRIRKNELNDWLLDNPSFKIGGITKEDIEYISLINFTTYTQVNVDIKSSELLLQNGWELSNGRNISHFYIWVFKGSVNKKINPLEQDNYISEGWTKGRVVDWFNDKITIHKGNKQLHVSSDDLQNYIDDGFELGGYKKGTLQSRKLIYVCNDTTKEQKNIKDYELDDFLKNNEGWRKGQFKRDKFSTIDKVFVVRLSDGKKITITSDEYKLNNNLYVGVKTKKVKIKKGSRILFQGYLKDFLIQNNYNKLPFEKALRSIDGKVFVTRGKDMYLNELNLSIKYL
jgi:hypothetical protein